MPNINYKSAVELLELFRAEQTKPSEVMQAYIDRYNEVNDKVNAFSFTFFESAIEQAQQADIDFAKQDTAAMSGLAIAIKDETYIEGQVTTNGCALLKDSVAKTTDPVARKIIDKKAIVHGRTTTPEFSVASTCWSSLWGVSRNPWNVNITCGGSSGGSAIAVATGMCALANGTDIGGSIRIPAAFCGLYGFKPAHGRVPEIAPYNIDPYCHHGVLTRTIDDAIFSYNQIKGSDWEDSHSFIPQAKEDMKPVHELKVAVSKDLGFYTVEDDILANLDKAVNELKVAGIKVDYVDLNWDEQVIDTAKIHQRANMGQLLSRIWDRPDRFEYLNSYTQQYLSKVKELKASDILDANLHLCKMWQELAPILSEYDVLLCPTLASTNVPADFDYSKDDMTIKGKKVDANKGWFMTYPFNSLGQLPVLAMPNGFCDNGVPSSMQIVGRPYQDQAIFTLAKYLSNKVTDGIYQTKFPLITE